MKLYWTPQALTDRQDIWTHLAASSPVAAVKMDEKISDAAAQLAAQPYLGPLAKIAGTREISVDHDYRLIYEVGTDATWILALLRANG